VVTVVHHVTHHCEGRLRKESSHCPNGHNLPGVIVIAVVVVVVVVEEVVVVYCPVSVSSG
jgi:hypothetical protein